MKFATLIATLAAFLAFAATATAGVQPPKFYYDCSHVTESHTFQTFDVSLFKARQLEAVGWSCSWHPDPTPPPPVAGCGTVANDGPAVACPIPFVPAPSSSMMCRIMDANEQPVAVLDSEILSADPGGRSLADGWLPASYIGDRFVCVPVAHPKAWTDDSLSVYDAPNTAYANPIG
jgi:hypothetical protein